MGKPTLFIYTCEDQIIQVKLQGHTESDIRMIKKATKSSGYTYTIYYGSLFTKRAAINSIRALERFKLKY
jgi:hypothetical protein